MKNIESSKEFSALDNLIKSGELEKYCINFKDVRNEFEKITTFQFQSSVAYKL